jgi:hypothetical protein
MPVTPITPSYRRTDPNPRATAVQSMRAHAADAETGIDYLAVGALTHSSPALDLGMDLTRPAQSSRA